MVKGSHKDALLQLVREKGSEMTLRQKLHLTMLLSMPAIIAQFSFIAMQMIDAAMLGHLSTDEAAAVGLMSTTIWFFGGLNSALASGFAVQVAHRVGAGDEAGARCVIRQGFLCGIIVAMLLSVAGISLAPHIPRWLGAAEHIRGMAEEYFTIFCCGMPVIVINSIAAGSLRCSGNIKTPSMLMVMMCMLDVVFNYIFIFMLGMGTTGAAYGTLASYLLTMVCMVYTMAVKDKVLAFSHDTDGMGWSRVPRRKVLTKACRIGMPIALERGVMNTAQIAISGIIAPLGTIAIAANSFGINIESLCYMPGYGIAEASTTLVGQSKGAERRDYMHAFAWISMALGVGVMALMGVLMWIFAPEMFSVITNDDAVVSLGTDILRIEAWAEPAYAASIIATAVFVGAGKTLIPSLMNLASIWVVRVSLAVMLAPSYGLRGVWIAMAAELCFRGIIFTARMCTRGWSYVRHR